VPAHLCTGAGCYRKMVLINAGVSRQSAISGCDPRNRRSRAAHSPTVSSSEPSPAIRHLSFVAFPPDRASCVLRTQGAEIAASALPEGPSAAQLTTDRHAQPSLSPSAPILRLLRGLAWAESLLDHSCVDAESESGTWCRRQKRHAAESMTSPQTERKSCAANVTCHRAVC
jgi:hypothetical protein